MDIKATSDKEKEMLFTKYGKLSIEKEENPKSKFYVGILDRFSKPLSIKEAENLLISYTPSNKRTQKLYFEQETKFLKFFKFAYEFNGEKPVYVFCPEFFDLKRKAYTAIINTFNDNDKKLLKMLLKNTNKKYDTFKVDNEELLQLFAKLSLRELCFSNFFFDESSSIIIGNYELNFPVYCLPEFSMKIYEKKATDLGLYIR